MQVDVAALRHERELGHARALVRVEATAPRIDVDVFDGDVQPQLDGQTVERAPRAFELAPQALDDSRDRVRLEADAVPTGREARRAPDGPRAVAAHVHRDPRVGERARIRLDVVEREELARERRRARRPQQLHDLDELVAVGAAAFVRHLCDHVVLHLQGADAHTDVEAAVAEVIDRGQRLRGGHRVQVGDHEHARAQPRGRRRRGEGGERDERVVVGALPHQPFRDEPAVQHVMAHPQRVGAERLRLHREVDDLLRGVEPPAVGCDVTEAKRHIQREGRGGTRSCISSASSARSTPLVTRSSTAARHRAAYASCDG